MGAFVQTGLFAVFSSPSLKPGFRDKQNLLHEGKIGFSVFSIHVWSSHFPASPPLRAVELHFMEKWNFLILSWIFHLPCMGGLAESVFWISLHPNNHYCPVLQIYCFEHWKNRTCSWKKMEELKLTKVSQPEPSLETKFPRWVSLSSRHCKNRFLAFAYALPTQLFGRMRVVLVFHA